MSKKSEIESTPFAANIDNLMGDMLDNIPESQPHIVDKINSDKKATQEAPRAEGFDPKIHMQNPDGSPVLTKLGKFRKITNIEKKKLVDPTAKIEPTAEEMAIANSQAAAGVVQDLKRNAYGAFLDCKYSDDRHNLYVQATSNYFISTGGVQITPLQSLMLLEGGLILEALQQEKAQSKLIGIKSWLANKYFKLKNRGRNGSQSGARTNDIGQDEINTKDTAKEMPSNGAATSGA